MHRTYVADIERGGRNVTLKSVGHLANALQVSVADLLSLDRPNSNEEAIPVEGDQLGEILLVEDNTADAELVVRAFKRARLTNPVRVVVDGGEALEYLMRTGRHEGRAESLPQLILLDLNLPTVSGMEVLAQIKQDAKLRQVPVVVLTGSENDRIIVECGRLGAENYIVKPVVFENFSRITAALNLHWTLVTGQPAPIAGAP